MPEFHGSTSTIVFAAERPRNVGQKPRPAGVLPLADGLPSYRPWTESGIIWPLPACHMDPAEYGLVYCRIHSRPDEPGPGSQRTRG